MSIRAVIFDVDGVLIDAADWHFKAFNQALCPFNTRISRQEHAHEFLGLTSAAKIERLVQRGLVPEDSLTSILNSKRREFQILMSRHCNPDPNRVRLLTELRNHKLLLGAVSNATRESVLEMLDRSLLRNYLTSIVCGDDVTSPKPAPEIYLTCASALRVSPETCLAVEDGNYGIQAAQAAGMQILRIRAFRDVTYHNIMRVIRMKEFDA